MNKKIWFGISFMLIGLLYFLIPLQKEEENSKLSATIEGRAEWEELYTASPETGEIPTENLIDAYQFIQRNKNQSRNLEWREEGPNNVSGRTRSLLIDASDPTGNTMWSGGVSGGLWKTTDGGNNWENVNEFFQSLAIGAIAQDPNNPNIMYFGTGEGYLSSISRGVGIYKTIDGGKTFSLLTNTNDRSDFYFINDMLVAPTGTLLAASESIFCNRGGLLRSGDGGISWGKFTDEDNCADVDNTFNFATEVEMGSDGKAYVAFGLAGDHDGVFMSQNDGFGWSQIYEAVPGESRIEMSVAPSDPNVIYLVIENDTEDGIPFIKKTTDGGESWTTLPTPRWNNSGVCSTTRDNWGNNLDWYALTVKVHPTNPDIIFVGTVDLFRSMDGGNNWEQLSTWRSNNCFPYLHADQHIIEFAPNGDMIIGNDGGLYRSENILDNRPTFEFISNGYNVTQFYALDHHPDEGSNYVLAGSQDNGTQQFNENGLENTEAVTGGDGGFCHIDQDNPNLQIASFIYNQYWVTRDNWNSFRRFNLDAEEGLFINPTDYDDARNMLYAAKSDREYLRWDPSTYSSTTDQVISVFSFPTGASTTAVTVSPLTNDRVYFGFSTGEVYYVNDAHLGNSRTAIKIFGEVAGTVSCITIDPEDENHMLIVLSNYDTPSIYESTNALDPNPLWVSVEGNLPNIPVRWAVFNPNDNSQAVVATELGIWSTTNLNRQSTTWTSDNNGMENVRCQMLKVRPSDNRLYVATFGRGLFSTDSFFEEVTDADNDGFTSDVDCDDNNEAINPNAQEIANNNIDENCDGEILIIDEDKDGFNSDEDCDDDNPDINPNATEIPNNDIDEDCDGEALVIDNDMDGFNSDEDCDDNNADIFPGATEILGNGTDEDCDGKDNTTSTININGTSLKFYPNPVDNFLFFKTNLRNYQASILTSNGQLVKTFPSSSQDNRIDVSELNPGVYLLSITAQGKSSAAPIIIK